MAELDAVAGFANTQKTEEQKQQDQQAQEDAACCTECFVWCIRSASCLERFQFSLWVICGVLAPIFYGMYLTNEGSPLNYGYFLCCGLSLVLSCIATANFGGIRDFREVVKELRENVDKLIKQRQKIRGEVLNLQDVRFKLEQLEIEHSVSNARLRAQLRQYEEWYPDTLNTATAQYKQIKHIQEREKLNILKQRRKIIEAERDMLYNALREFEKRDDGKIGLTRKEFKSFVNALPRRYGLRIERSNQGFDDFCGFDYNIDREEFKAFLEELVLTEVEDLAKGFGINIPGLRDKVSAPPDANASQDDEKKNEPIENKEDIV